MSEPMRFSLKHHGQLSCVEHCPEGEYVLHSDYARLKAEVERLTKELSNISGWGRGLESDLSHARVEISFLKAEVERLRYVGDGMAVMVGHIEVTGDAHRMMLELSKEWEAAKEGKPSV